jgi:hypothetical protein
MRQIEQNKLNMWRAVLRHLQANSGVWVTTPAFVTAVKELTGILQQADAAGSVQQQRVEGATLTKDEYTNELIDQVLIIAGAAAAYALDNDEVDLYEQVNVKHWSLQRLTDAAQKQRIEQILSKVEAIKNILVANYGLNVGDFTRATEMVNGLSDAIAMPRNTIVNRKAATGSIPDIIARGRTILEKIDGLMRRFNSAQPVFASQYRFSRNVVDAGHRYEDTKEAEGGEGKSS